MPPSHAEKAIENLVVLVADSNPYMRRLTRMMLTNLGARAIGEKLGARYLIEGGVRRDG